MLLTVSWTLKPRGCTVHRPFIHVWFSHFFKKLCSLQIPPPLPLSSCPPSHRLSITPILSLVCSHIQRRCCLLSSHLISSSLLPSSEKQDVTLQNWSRPNFSPAISGGGAKYNLSELLQGFSGKDFTTTIESKSESRPPNELTFEGLCEPDVLIKLTWQVFLQDKRPEMASHWRSESCRSVKMISSTNIWPECWLGSFPHTL